MSKPLLKVVKNELRSEKRVLHEQKPKPLVPPKFDESEEVRLNFWNRNIKWHFSLKRFDNFSR